MTARRLQNWANRNLFIGSLSSFERDPDVPDVHLPRQKSQKNRTTNYGSNMPVQSTTEEEEEEATIDLTSMRTKKRDAMEADRSKQEQIPAAGDEAEGVGQGKPITALQAAWNVTNAIQGTYIPTRNMHATTGNLLA
jgi:hypothetical protein